MNRPPYSDRTLKILFARSQNRCAFEGCDSPIIGPRDVVLGEVCHIEGVGEKAARYNPMRTREHLNDEDNLILLCCNHHELVDKDVATYTVDRLRQMKTCHEYQGVPDLSPNEARYVKLILEYMVKKDAEAKRTYKNSTHYEARDNATQIINNNTTIINRRPKADKRAGYPADSIGGDNDRANYLSYLVAKYAGFAAWQHGKKNYAIMPGMLKRHFKIGGSRHFLHIPLSRFEEAVAFVQRAIENTKLGRIKKSQQLLYQSFDDYCEQNG